MTTKLASGLTYRSYAEMKQYLLELNTTFRDVVHVSIAQETYGLPYPDALDCIINDETKDTAPCQHFVVHLTNHSTLKNDPERPEVFISGALHGNERIGPNAAIELIALVAHGTSKYRSKDTVIPTFETQQWLLELVNTRNIVIMPMTNAFGYAHNTREELTLDPNRDFNYMRTGVECMQTITARVVNEIWRDHIFQLAVTFHGGTRAIAYEWGSPDHYLDGNPRKSSEKSPDHTAQLELSTTLAHFAGAFQDGQLYPTGTMNDIVYGVSGGMEDWGYAASWENQFYDELAQPFHPCDPKTFGGYPRHKTIYNNVTHRAFNMLVETANDKIPDVLELGDKMELYGTNVDFFRMDNSKIKIVGHVPRNVRLALMMIEMVQPYLRWVHAAPSASKSSLSIGFQGADVYTTSANQVIDMGCGEVAWKRHDVATCSTFDCRVEDRGFSKLQLAWEVLGALTVDSTYLQISSNKDFDDNDIFITTATQNGTTRRFYNFASNDNQAASSNEDTMGTSLFVTCLDLRNITLNKVYVRAVATVDQNWKQQGIDKDTPSPRVPPQSHLVNARTNLDWKFEWNGHRVKAALEWTSKVISIELLSNVQDDVKDEMTSSLSAENGSPEEDEVESQDSSNDNEEREDDSKEDTTETAASTLYLKVAIVTSDDSGQVDDESNQSDDTESQNEIAEHEQTTRVRAHTLGDITTLTSNDAKNSGLLRFGYIIMSFCALIIVLTIVYLYRRVFQRSRQTYMNIENVTQENIDRTDEMDGDLDNKSEERTESESPAVEA
ncbi:hypothetical protein F441_06112 [Plasmopara halstedii]|uniref:Peptidase M14 domain-containing protein n=1 Tax=Plasmopara halstedii TaxID=4781 RepID=A0A0P1ASX7_PLAHL|nr:hypothetical protein F441_06112 [Plasmopara halstedii]CEG45337.1 hypothetical protein F441_06112 [Plasmopara halstedii]|eukprot:XP_024581706.1 hypothetical protein F441_06112 [Plasmopara halstedii]